MAIISKNQLLEAGVHFGHNTRRWNPKMKEYIYGERNGIYIIDLDKTAAKIEEAYQALFNIVQNNGSVIFVGTRKQTQDVIKAEAIRAESYYVDQRWLGGTLTNGKTIRKSIGHLFEIEKMEEEGTFEVLPKKEVILIMKEKERLLKYFSGIRDMVKLPDAMVVVDPKSEHNAVAEAKKLKIPVFAIVDTNCDPDDADYVIPANDDAIRSVKLIIGTLANAVVEAKGGTPIAIEFTDEPVPEERPGRRRYHEGRGSHRDVRPRPRQPRPEAKPEAKQADALKEAKPAENDASQPKAPAEMKESFTKEPTEEKKPEEENKTENTQQENNHD